MAMVLRIVEMCAFKMIDTIVCKVSLSKVSDLWVLCYWASCLQIRCRPHECVVIIVYVLLSRLELGWCVGLILCT